MKQRFAATGREYCRRFYLEQYMVERRIELDRRYVRKKKMKKLKEKLTTATGEQRDKLLYKIRCLSPFWTEPAKEKAK